MPARIIIVAKRSSYLRYVKEQRDPVATRLLRKHDPTVAKWRQAHRDHVDTLREVERIATQIGGNPWVVHGPSMRFDTADAALVVTVGGDGTLLAASHHIGDVPILGVNSSVDHSVGFFCAANRRTVKKLLTAAYERALPGVKLARMEVLLNRGSVSRRILNEALFSHAIPAATSRYFLEYGGRQEEQRSSGVWVGPAAGSTGALRSAGGKVLPFSSKRLQLVVREPYLVRGHPYHFGRLIVGPDETITIRNKMHDARLFLDGPFQQVSVGLGDVVEFRTSREPLRLLGFAADRSIAEPKRASKPPRSAAKSGRGRHGS